MQINRFIGDIQSPGTIFFFLNDLINYIEINKSDFTVTLEMSCIEYSKSHFKDLLINLDFPYNIGKDMDGIPYIIGASKVKIKDLSDALKKVK